VRFYCRSCAFTRDVPLEEVIEFLRILGVGDEHTGIKAVARYARKRCERCGALNFDTSPAWASRENPASQPQAKP
jgi:hypothetical protein